MARSPYDVLGVPKTATDDEVKKAYRKLARESHPDATQGDTAAAPERLRGLDPVPVVVHRRIGEGGIGLGESGLEVERLASGPLGPRVRITRRYRRVEA